MQRGGGRATPRRGPGIAHRRTAAILVAAGRGHRARSPADRPKQFVHLAGRPLAEWSLDALIRFGCDPVVAAVPEDLVGDPPAWLERCKVIAGGPRRQDSVRLALEMIDTEQVVIHDAVRPFIDEGLIGAVLAALEEADGATAAIPMEETLKLVGPDRRVLDTVDRTGLWRVQTPQAFATSVLKDAHERAGASHTEFTDDAQLVENYGGTVVAVEGPRTNIKITFPEDFELAEAMAARLLA